MPPDKRFEGTKDVLSFKGIVSHINYRPSGKWDIGPAFDWATMIEGVQAAQYTSTASQRTGSRPELGEVLTSEEEIEAQFPGQSGRDEPEQEATDNEGYNPNDYEEKIGTERRPHGF